MINSRTPGLFPQPKLIGPCHCGCEVGSACPRTWVFSSLPAKSVSDPLYVGSVEVFAQKFIAVNFPHFPHSPVHDSSFKH